jgi:glycerophosphoryl diester phosphodiesterase
MLREDVKGPALRDLPPENSEESVEEAFKNGYHTEIDVVMTKDNEIVITHTNELYLHIENAKKGEYVCDRTLAEMKEMQTGLAGRKSPFMTYEGLIKLLYKYPSAKVNVEIKGVKQPGGQMAEPKDPSLIDVLVQKTPKTLYERIVWSSFATSDLVRMKELAPQANVAHLFGSNKPEEAAIYPDTDDRYWQFNLENLKKIHAQIPALAGVHVFVDTVFNPGMMAYCNAHGLDVRTWVTGEKKPTVDDVSRQNILNVLKVKERFPEMKIDIISDFPVQVAQVLQQEKNKTVANTKYTPRNIGGRP